MVLSLKVVRFHMSISCTMSEIWRLFVEKCKLFLPLCLWIPRPLIASDKWSAYSLLCCVDCLIDDAVWQGGRTNGHWATAYTALCICVKYASRGKKNVMKCILVSNILLQRRQNRRSRPRPMNRCREALNLVNTANKANSTNETNVGRSSARYIAISVLAVTFNRLLSVDQVQN